VNNLTAKEVYHALENWLDLGTKCVL